MNTHNPFEISNSLGIHIVFTSLLEHRGYYKNIDGFDFIVISNTLAPIVQTFVCAHELGHYFLHKGYNRIFMDSYTYMRPSKYENEADTFAANLLWSEPPLLEENILTDWQMAECLNINKCNVNERLLELGIYWEI